MVREAYRGWIAGAQDRSDLTEDRSESLDALDPPHGRPAQARPSHGAVSLRARMPPILDQGDLQSCTAHALAAAVGFDHPNLHVSRLQLYYLSRAYEHKTYGDLGARLHNAVRALRDHGVAHEQYWPYDERKVSDRPRPAAMDGVEQHRIKRYAHLCGGAEYRACLDRGHPFVIGIHHTDAFWSDASKASGVLSTPAPTEPRNHSHAVCVIGYAWPCARARIYLKAGDPEREALYYEVRNSAGPDWGDDGHFWIPEAYLEDRTLAFDAWTVRR